MVKRIECTECEGSGETVSDSGGAYMTCEGCGGEGLATEYNVIERTRQRLYETRAGQRYLRARGRVRHVRQMWRERDAPAVAYVQAAHKGILGDEPRLHGMIEHEMNDGIGPRATTYGWRMHDLRWALTNARRALRGEPMLPLDYEEMVRIDYSDYSVDYFQRDLIQVRAERYRKMIRRDAS